MCIADEPLEFDANPTRGAGLQADAMDMFRGLFFSEDAHAGTITGGTDKTAGRIGAGPPCLPVLDND